MPAESAISLHGLVGGTMMVPVELVRTLMLLVGLADISMADLPRSPTTPASVAMLCWSGVELEVDKTMPFVVSYFPSVMLSRNDWTLMVSVVATPLTVVVRVAVTLTQPTRAKQRNAVRRVILDGVEGFDGMPSRSR